MRLGLRERLFAGFAVMFLLTALVGVVGYIQGRQAAGQAADIYQRDVRGLEELSAALQDMLEMRQAVLLELITEDAGARRALDAEIPALSTSIDGHFSALSAIWTSGTKRQALDDLRKAWAAYPPIRDRTRALALSGRVDEAKQVASASGRDTFRNIHDNVVQLTAANRQITESRYADVRASLVRWRLLTVALTLVALGAAFTLAVRLARRIGGGVAEVAGSAARLAAGDLSSRAEIHTADELESLASSFNQMAERIQHMIQAEREATGVLQTAVGEYSAFAARLAEGDLTVRLTADTSPELHTLSGNLNEMAGALAVLSRRVRDEVERITASAGEILTSVSQHATSAREQSAAISETSATANEVRVSAEDTARRAEAVADQARDSAKAGAEGRQAVDAIVAGMHDIRGKVDEIADGIVTLSGQTQQVGEIISLVNDLADQSNLLAVNAAIEAAKAGEQGRGFGVVADEVRTLADQSKQATVQIRDILDQVQRSANAAVLATEQGTRVVESGERLAERAGQVIATLSDLVQHAAQSSRQIAASAHQQSVGMDQIATAMRNLQQTTEQFQTGAQRSQATARSLNDVANRLDELTARYRLTPQ